MILFLRIVPGFSVAVEERTRPELRAHPLIIGGLPQQRGLVREANLTAQRCGVRAGMTCAQALQYCPDAVLLLPDPPRYEALWAEICTALSTFTPLVQPLEMGQAVCDLSGCERQWSDIWEAASEVVRCVGRYGITPWVGVASNRLVADLASTAVGPDGITVVETGQERVFLADLPLLSLPDIDPRMALTFQVLGLKTIGQLAALPAAAVKQRFGSAGEKLHRYAHGIDPRAIVPPPDRAAITARHECEDGSIEEVAEALHQLAAACAAELDQRHTSARLISLTLYPLSQRDVGRPLRGRLVPSPTADAPLCPLSPDPSPSEGGGEIVRETRKLESLPSLTTAPPTDSPFLPSPSMGEGSGVRGLDLPYRIHSMLPQPSTSELAHPNPQPISPPLPTQLIPSPPSFHISHLSRTPLDSSSAIAERAQRLLLQIWPRDAPHARVESIKLEISEFQGPIQLSFAELDRLDQAGALRGMDPVRLQALGLQEQALAARYGDTPFRHVTHVDPASILTERRFRWKAGLPPAHESRPSRARSRTSRRRA